jgi:hypothetical protein
VINLQSKRPRPVNGHQTALRGLYLTQLIGQPAPTLTNVPIKVAGPTSRNRKPGSVLVGVATGLLLLLAIGLFVVSLAAQYKYVFGVKHQSMAAMIEAVALDLGMSIFSLLALGLARAGKSARVERVLVVACAAGSAIMNYAASDAGSARSVLAYIAPPLFLAVVVDRVVAVVRRHMLGDDERSPWSAFGRVALYALRLPLAPISTPRGLRQWLLLSTPLPAAPVKQAVAEVIVAPVRPRAIDAPKPKARKPAKQATSKTARFLALVTEKHGPLADLPLDRVSPICTELAGLVYLDTAAARGALGKAVLGARQS